MRLLRVLGFLAVGLLLASGTATAEERFITVASTTSTEDSGLFEAILPRFTAETGIAVRVVAVGTGQAIKLAENGDADVLFVHAKAAEEQFVAAGHGVERNDVMYNDFVVVGPADDPAGIKGETDVVTALDKIAKSNATFLSRGDDSGTHKAELKLWQAAGIDVAAASGGWYRETGSGMGATLNTAAGLGAYTLSDRATWLAFQNKRDLVIVVEGDQRLFNQYGIILVNPARHPHVKAADGQAFIDWILSKAGQSAISGFTLDGQQLFFPNAENEGS